MSPLHPPYVVHGQFDENGQHIPGTCDCNLHNHEAKEAEREQTYRGCVYPITEEDLADPDLILAMKEAAKRSAIIGLELDGCIATTEPEAEFIRNSSGPKIHEYEDEDGNRHTITAVGGIYGQIKGCKP